MKITFDVELRSFKFQSPLAKETASYITFSEMDRIQQILEDAYPNGMTDSNLEDIFGYEVDTIANWIGYDNFEQVKNRMGVQESRKLNCHRKAIATKRKSEGWRPHYGEVNLDRDKNMYVCENCLGYIESREGPQRATPIMVDEDDLIESKCDWCDECGFDTLYEI